MISKHAQAYVRQRNKKLEEELELKAGKDDIISTINLSSEGVAIQGNKIDLTGAVSVNDNVTIDEDGKITAVDGTFSGTITGSTFSATGETTSDAMITVDCDNADVKTRISAGYIYVQDAEASDVKTTKISEGSVECIVGDYRYHSAWLQASPTYGGMLTLYDISYNEKIIARGSTGNITCVSLTQTSDRNAKEGIKEIPEENAVRFIKSLRPVEFKFKGMDGKHHGFIAQEVVADWDLVSEGEMKSLAYNEIIADLVATVQNLTKRVEVLEERLNG